MADPRHNDVPKGGDEDFSPPREMPKFHVYLTTAGKLLIKDEQDAVQGEAASVPDCLLRIRKLTSAPKIWVRFHTIEGQIIYEMPIDGW